MGNLAERVDDWAEVGPRRAANLLEMMLPQPMVSSE